MKVVFPPSGALLSQCRRWTGLICAFLHINHSQELLLQPRQAPQDLLAAKKHVACRYVCRKNTTTNAVYVSRQYFGDMHSRNTFWCYHFNWVDPAYRQQRPDRLQCKVRHGPAIYWADIEWSQIGTAAHVILDANDQGLAPGQFAVFYRDRACLGSAVICTDAEAMKCVEQILPEVDAYKSGNA